MAPTEPTGLMTEMLNGLRDEVRGLRDESRKTSERLDHTHFLLDRLEQRQIASEIRLGTELDALKTAVGEVRDLLETRKR